MIAELDLLDDQIYTLLTQYVEAAIPSLEDDNFSMVKSDPSEEAELPFIYLSRITAIESADDLECDQVNGGLFTYQVKVTSNVSKEEVKEIMKEVTKAFKKMMFRATSLPVFVDTDNLHIQISRWQREICEGDEL